MRLLRRWLARSDRLLEKAGRKIYIYIYKGQRENTGKERNRERGKEREREREREREARSCGGWDTWDMHSI